MNYLRNILKESQLDELKQTFDKNVLNQLNDYNVFNIISYLKMHNIYFIEDIIMQYLDLFLMEKEQFVKKFEMLKRKYSYQFIEMLEFHLDILEEMLV